MGGKPYWYHAPCQDDIDAALQDARQCEFEAGRFAPVMPSLRELCPIRPEAPAPGVQRASIEEAMVAVRENGTRRLCSFHRG